MGNKKAGREEAAKISLNGRSVSDLAFDPVCLKSLPCQHAWFKITLSDGTEISPALPNGAAFAHFLIALGARDLLKASHFGIYA